MRFLVDENLSPEVADRLRSAGHDAEHVRDIGMKRARDVAIRDRARQDDRVLVTADTDFGGLLAHGGWALPSVVLLRRLQGGARTSRLTPCCATFRRSPTTSSREPSWPSTTDGCGSASYPSAGHPTSPESPRRVTNHDQR